MSSGARRTNYNYEEKPAAFLISHEEIIDGTGIANEDIPIYPTEETPTVVAEEQVYAAPDDVPAESGMESVEVYTTHEELQPSRYGYREMPGQVVYSDMFVQPEYNESNPEADTINDVSHEEVLGDEETVEDHEDLLDEILGRRLAELLQSIGPKDKLAVKYKVQQILYEVAREETTVATQAAATTEKRSAV